MSRKTEPVLKPLMQGERDRLSELQTRYMVLGLDAMPERERAEREELAKRLYVTPARRRKERSR